MKDRIEKIIKDWLQKEFHNKDAIPGLVVSGLAEEINNHRWEIHTNVQNEYDMEDIDSISESNGIKLTEDEKRRVLWRYKKLEDSNLDTLSYIIDEIVDGREKTLSSTSSSTNGGGDTQ